MDGVISHNAFIENHASAPMPLSIVDNCIPQSVIDCFDKVEDWVR